MALPLSYNVRNILVRWKVTLLALAGSALVVAVLLVLTAMANGFRMALEVDRAHRERDRHAARIGVGAELRHLARQRQHDHGRFAREARCPGAPAGVAGNDVVVALPKRGDGTEVNVTVRGVSPMAFAVRQNVEDRPGPHLHARASTS